MRLSGFRVQLLAGLAVLAASTLIAGAVIQKAGAATNMDEKTVMVGGAPMYPSKNIVQNAIKSKDHTTLVAAVKARVGGNARRSRPIHSFRAHE